MDKKQYDDSKITPIGITNWRNVRKQFGIRARDRLGHVYVIGKTGTGKSTLQCNASIPGPPTAAKGSGVHSGREHTNEVTP